MKVFSIYFCVHNLIGVFSKSAVMVEQAIRSIILDHDFDTVATIDIITRSMVAIII